MLKKLFGALLFAFICATTNATAKAADPAKNVPNQSLEKLYKFKLKTVNEIEYWWVLGNDGCFHLYRVEIVGGILEFWTALGYWNYIGTTTNCVYSQEAMEVMC